jgi:hypothetical protein
MTGSSIASPLRGENYPLSLQRCGPRQLPRWIEAIALLQQLLAIPAGEAVSIERLKPDPVWDPTRDNGYRNGSFVGNQDQPSNVALWPFRGARKPHWLE